MKGIPKTYWEKRSYINEQIMERFIVVMGTAFPETQKSLDELIKVWEDALTLLQEEEMKDAGDEA